MIRGATRSLATVIAVLFIVMAFAMAFPAMVAAVDTDTPTMPAKVTAGGWVISDNQPGTGADLIGHECHYGVVAMYDAKKMEWKGQGSFMDKDYEAGTLKAILTIDYGKVKVPPPEQGYSLYKLEGDARVSIDQEFVGVLPFKLTLEDWVSPLGVQFYTISLWIDMPSGPDYLIWAFPDVDGGTITAH